MSGAAPGTPAPRWDAERYLRFEAERTLPCRDLARRIDLAGPKRVVDLGCGPGNSTAVLAARWPGAHLTGVDSSEEMLAKARASDVRAEWITADVSRWTPDSSFDLVFSNAVLHWLPDHRALLPRLAGWAAPGGALAFQVPARTHPPPPWMRALARMAAAEPWRSVAPADASESNVLSLAEYYDVLCDVARRVDLWDTEYDHVLEGPEAVVEWIRGTALRPWLARLPDPDVQARFLAELSREIAREYPRRRDGNLVFPFLRRFVIAYR